MEAQHRHLQLLLMLVLVDNALSRLVITCINLVGTPNNSGDYFDKVLYRDRWPACNGMGSSGSGRQFSMEAKQLVNLRNCSPGGIEQVE